MNTPRVSLVIPAHNHATYLGAAIDSVLAQDYPALDLLVLDDGSTDATPALLARYTGRLRWERQPNMGQAATLNKGWGMTDGELIGYLSSDDVLKPRAVSTAVQWLAADPDRVLVYCDYELIDSGGGTLRRVRAPEFDYREMVTRFVCPPGPGALFQRAAAEAAGPWNSQLRLTPDYDFWLRLCLQGTAQRIPEVLAAFRVHETSASFASVSPAQSEEYVTVLAEYFRRGDAPADVKAAQREAMSNAYLFAARSHLRSSRYGMGASRACRGIATYPANVRLRSGKILAHGFLNHVRYRRRARALP